MSGWNILPYDLLNLKGPQLLNQPWPDDKANEKGSQNGIDCPEGNISKNIKKGVNLMKRIE
jgi:hypothetical protein